MVTRKKNPESNNNCSILSVSTLQELTDLVTIQRVRRQRCSVEGCDEEEANENITVCLCLVRFSDLETQEKQQWNQDPVVAPSRFQDVEWRKLTRFCQPNRE